MNNINIEVQKLYLSKKYYLKINRSINHEFSENYWGLVKDPDGKIRNRLSSSEKNNHIKDTKYISTFINNYYYNKNFLDVGCGLGYFLSSIKSDNNYLYGTELDDFSINKASKHGKIFKGKLKNINFKKYFFDIILMHHVIEHLKKPEEEIKIIKNILKKNGTLIIATPDFDSGAARLFKNKYRLLKDKTHISLFSNESMHRFLRDNGFEILKVEYPYFNTRFFTKKNLLSLLNKNINVSPPFYGNYMTFFCRKK